MENRGLKKIGLSLVTSTILVGTTLTGAPISGSVAFNTVSTDDSDTIANGATVYITGIGTITGVINGAGAGEGTLTLGTNVTTDTTDMTTALSAINITAGITTLGAVTSATTTTISSGATLIQMIR